MSVNTSDYKANQEKMRAEEVFDNDFQLPIKPAFN
jgi:hypothetical protein